MTITSPREIDDARTAWLAGEAGAWSRYIALVQQNVPSAQPDESAHQGRTIGPIAAAAESRPVRERAEVAHG